MNRFGSGYDDLFDAFDGPGEEGSTESSGEGRRPSGGDAEGADPLGDGVEGLPDDLAEFLARAAAGADDESTASNGWRFDREAGPRRRQPAMRAAVDVVEVAEGLLIVFDLPGVSEADVELAAAPRAIRLRASRRLPLPPGARTRRRERAAGTVERIVPVPPGYDSGSLEARLSAGVLAVMVPRHEASEQDGGGQSGGSGLWNDG